MSSVRFVISYNVVCCTFNNLSDALCADISEALVFVLLIEMSLPPPHEEEARVRILGVITHWFDTLTPRTRQRPFLVNI